MSDVEERLRPVRPRILRGRLVSYPDIPTLYLEDITKIYRIMKEANREDTFDDRWKTIRAKQREAQQKLEGLIGQLRANNAQMAEDLAAKGIEINLAPVDELNNGFDDQEVDTEPPETESEPPVHLESDEYEFDDLEQFRSLPRKSIPKLSMRTADFRLRLSCNRYSVSLEAADDDPETLAAFAQIDAVLNNRRAPKWGFLLSVNGFLLTTGLISVVVIILGYLRFPQLNWGLWTIYVFSLVFLIFFGIPRRIWNSYPVIVPRTRMESPSWLEANNGMLIVNLIVAIVAAVLGAVAIRVIGGPGS
jgi:hypothetical protein